MMNEVVEQVSAKRVRRSSHPEINKEVDEEMIRRIEEAQTMSNDELSLRIEELDKEWDIERALELNASILALSGTGLGALVDKRWYILPAVVTAFLMQHALQGWCPPLPLLRKLGFRSRQEIDEEKMALKILRGDLKDISPGISAEELLQKVRN
jgi:hypothetical protein